MFVKASILSTYFMNIYHISMFLASGKCENTLKYQYMKVFSIFK